MEAYQGDLAKTEIIRSLCDIPKEQRDEDWKNKFCSAVAYAGFASGSPSVITGPDGFLYFQLSTPASRGRIPEPSKEFQSFVIQRMKDDFLLREGYGVVINANKGEPDWVFSYGDILNYHLAKEFYTVSDNWKLPSLEVIEEDEEVLIGQPSESFLPRATRTVIGDFLKSLDVNDGKLLLMSRQKPQGISRELVFNLTPEKFAMKEQFENIMRCISWYLPRHYRYVSMNESIMENNFEPI